MDSHNLHTASVYINNLLLARGLLRNGKSIDFARPENGAGGADATMAKIINLVNDLVLRRDREAEQRESLATTIRSLRSGESRQTVELDKLQTEKAELARSLALAEGQERAFKTNLRNAEATVRGLKEQMQRMKSTLQQIRSQCANDIRKRDVEINKLKSHLTERQRGKREGMGVTTIKITPPPKSGTASRAAEGGEGLDNPGYSLKQETTEFLTRLCQNLSDENDALINLARNTVHTLNELQGLQNAATEGADRNSDGQEDPTAGDSSPNKSEATILPTSYESLSSDMEAVLDSLRTILTNPSFVPLEEVEIRDEEIFRLRESWEKMEERWKEAVAMMDGWHRRIASGGATIDVDELKSGMELGLGNGGDSRPEEMEEDIGSEAFLSDGGNTEQQAQNEETASNHDLEDTDARNTDSASAPVHRRKRRSRALGERSGNSRPPTSPRKVSFANELVNHSNHFEDEEDEEDEDELMLVDEPNISNKREQSKSEQKPKTRSKIPCHIPKPTPKMTVSEKLAAVESEAKVAEESRKKEETRKRPRDQDKRPAKSGRRGRRKSTLSPEELEQLIGVSSTSS